MRTRFTLLLSALLLVAPGTLVAQRPAARPAPWPAVAPVRGPLRITVTYPAAGTAIAAGDSTFLFGTVGDGRASLTVAGRPVTVAPNGAWLAWVPIPRDSVFALALEARLGGDTARADLPLRRAGWVREEGAWVDRGSMAPTGDVRLPRDEPLPLTVRAAPGARVRLRLADGTVIPFVADSIAPVAGAALRAFDHDDRNLQQLARGDRYVGVAHDAVHGVPGLTPLSAWPREASGRPDPVLEVIVGADTSRTPWPLRVARLTGGAVAVRLDDDPLRKGGTDRTTIGRGLPGGTYSWFFPQGTRTRAEARIGNDVRLRLDGAAIAWVPADEVHPAAAPDDPRTAYMGSLTLTPDSSGRTRLRIPLSRPIPMRVDEDERALSITLADVVADADWTRFVANTRFVSSLTWRQETADRVVLTLRFARPLWGWRVRAAGTDLVFEFREPPAIDPARPLKGRHIVVDPGHPPVGACGPTNLCEPEANLGVAQQVRDLLVAQGAHVTMTRTGMESVGLWERVAHADSLDAELLVSIHNNALPDGVNPETNSGTSTFYNHLPSLPYARAVQRALVASLGLRDLGIARGDLALVRPTWYPSVLTEGLFLMVPAQEASLRTVAGRRRYAVGVVNGIRAFLAETGRMSTSSGLGRP